MENVYFRELKIEDINRKLYEKYPYHRHMEYIPQK